jgi:hypothetical protein
MTETRVVMLCAECAVFWSGDAEPAACTDAGHEHQRFDVHRHRDVVVMPDGTEVVAVSFDEPDPYQRDLAPDFGLYLDPRWQPPWPHHVLDWPDFGVPEDPAVVVAALESLRERSRSGARVEIGCLGAHGRTGTALACLAVLCGQPAPDAVAWVRRTYCEGAVETDEQARFVAALEA